jgi:hypothetical protein
MNGSTTIPQRSAAETVPTECSQERERESLYRDRFVRPTSQAERAVMHPERHDTEWRYYYGAWHS